MASLNPTGKSRAWRVVRIGENPKTHRCKCRFFMDPLVRGTCAGSDQACFNESFFIGN